MKPRGVVHGAFLITLATLLVRVLGAVYRPVVQRLFAPWDGMSGDAGLGLANAPMAAYQIILAFSSVGFNVAISKLVAERLARHDIAGARRIFRLSFQAMAALGFVLALVFWFGADTMARWPGWPEAAGGFRAMAPGLFIVALVAAYRGVFQGFQVMEPNAYSQVIEQVLRVATGMVLVAVLAPISVAKGAAGFNFGDTAGAAAALLYLWWLYRRRGRLLWDQAARVGAEQGAETAARQSWRVAKSGESTWSLLVSIFRVALPIALISAILPLMQYVDTLVVPRRLLVMGITDESVQQAAIGALGNSLGLIYLPGIFSSALYVALLPAVAASAAEGDPGRIRARASSGYRFTALVAVPATIGLYVLAREIYGAFYHGSGYEVLAAMAVAPFFMMMQQTSSAILQGMGQVGLPVRNLLFGAALKLALTWVLTANPAFGIRGAAYATVAGFIVPGVLNMLDATRLIRGSFDWIGTIVKPGLAAAGMAAGLFALRPTVAGLVHSIWTGGPGAAFWLQLGVLIPLGALLYGLLLIWLGGVTRHDLELVPFVGGKLARLLQRIGLVR